MKKLCVTTFLFFFINLSYGQSAHQEMSNGKKQNNNPQKSEVEVKEETSLAVSEKKSEQSNRSESQPVLSVGSKKEDE